MRSESVDLEGGGTRRRGVVVRSRGAEPDRSLVKGSLPAAVWRIAWPTMLQNVIGGLQGIVDHVMVGHFVGYTANAAIGVSWQVFLVVIVFVSSLSTGMSVLVARFTGAGQMELVNRTVQQAILTSLGLSFLVLAPLGYLLAPRLLDLVNAAPEVQLEALPYLRIVFGFGGGIMLYFMIGAALRSAGDARTPLRLGVTMTLLNLILNFTLIRGLGPIPALGTAGAALGTVLAMGMVGAYAIFRLWQGGWAVRFPRGGVWRPDWGIIREIFRFGLPAGAQGVAMSLGGVMLLGFIGSLAEGAEAQAAYAVVYTELFSLITWTAIGLMGAAATVAGQNLGAKQPERVVGAVHTAARFAIVLAGGIGILFFTAPHTLLGFFALTDPVVVSLGVELMRYLSVSGLFVAVALTYTGGLQGTGDTRSPLFISLISQVGVPIGICFGIQTFGTLEAVDIWRAILLGHITRCLLSVVRFRQGRWRDIEVAVEARR